jgi:hypothetical protein
MILAEQLKLLNDILSVASRMSMYRLTQISFRYEDKRISITLEEGLEQLSQGQNLLVLSGLGGPSEYTPLVPIPALPSSPTSTETGSHRLRRPGWPERR